MVDFLIEHWFITAVIIAIVIYVLNSEGSSRQSFEQRQLNDIKFRADYLRKAEIGKLIEFKLTKIHNLLLLSPSDFQDAVIHMYSELGYEVTHPLHINNKGKNAILIKDGKKYLVECKRWDLAKKVGRPDLMKFFAAIKEERAEKGFLITTGQFTSTAYEYASKNQIELVDGYKLVDLMKTTFHEKVDDIQIKLMCQQCGDIVNFNLSDEGTAGLCKKGHQVEFKLKSWELSPSELKIRQYCPRCGGTLKLRTGKYGEFWGCSNFNKRNRCTYTKPINK